MKTHWFNNISNIPVAIFINSTRDMHIIMIISFTYLCFLTGCSHSDYNRIHDISHVYDFTELDVPSGSSKILALHLTNDIDWDYWCRSESPFSACSPALKYVLLTNDKTLAQNATVKQIRSKAAKISPDYLNQHFARLKKNDNSCDEWEGLEIELGRVFPYLIINEILKDDPENISAWSCLDYYMLHVSEESPYDRLIYSELRRHGLLNIENKMGKKYLEYSKMEWYKPMWNDILLRHKN